MSNWYSTMPVFTNHAIGYVTAAIAANYATEDWPIERIKSVHGLHMHTDENGDNFISAGCPNCRHCHCPVPDKLHSYQYLT